MDRLSRIGRGRDEGLELAGDAVKDRKAKDPQHHTGRVVETRADVSEPSRKGRVERIAHVPIRGSLVAVGDFSVASHGSSGSSRSIASWSHRRDDVVEQRQDGFEVAFILRSMGAGLEAQDDLGSEVADAVEPGEQRLIDRQADRLVARRDPGRPVVRGHREVEDPGARAVATDP